MLLAREAIESQKNLEKHRGKMEPNIIEELLILFSPWLLSIAIALRITKVTAGLRGYTDG